MEEDMLLIGATGKVGQRLVPLLIEAEARPTVFVRDVDAARTLYGDRVDYVQGDLADPESVDAAMVGQDTVYLAVGQTDEQVVLEKNAIDAAVRAGVNRIVKISAMTAGHGPIEGPNPFARWHAEIEQHLAEAPLTATILRPNMFDDNLLGSAPQIAAGQLYSTSGEGRTAWVHPRDIAELAAVALLDDSTAGKVYEVTGPEAITHDELAERFTSILGKPVQHIAIDDDSFRGALGSAGLPGWVVDAFVEMNARTVRDGLAGTVSEDIPNVLGRPATSIDAWIEENRSAFVG
jgi:uncharacterized protein YbjT (DUF2867 family)